MYPKAINKAKSRLRVAQKAATGLTACKSYDDFCDQWYVFLHAAKNIYTVLEQGAKATPQARQWFGTKNNLRKNDPLLRYISEARNDDEHGIEAISELVPGALKIGVNKPGYSSHMIDEFGNTFTNCGTAYSFTGIRPSRAPLLRPLDGKPVGIEETLPHVKLISVHDRSKRAYAPPASHLGQPLTNNSPQAVAHLTVVYLETLVLEAEGFRKP